MIVIDDIAKAVKSVWPSIGGVNSGNTFLNRRPESQALPFGLMKITEGPPIRESNGIAIQRFEVMVQTMTMDPTTTRVLAQGLASIVQRLLDSALLYWPAGTPAVPDVLPAPAGTLETDPRLRSAADVFVQQARFSVIIQPVP